MDDTTAREKISVILPFYNAAQTLSRTLETLRQSSLQPYKVLCVDDASSDDASVQLWKNETATMLPLKCFCPLQKKQRAAATRNCGAAVAQGEYLLFLDADVLVEKKTIEQMMNRLSER